MTILDLVEVLVYVLIDLIPNLLLAVIPFRDYLRYSPRIITISIITLYIIVVSSRLIGLQSLEAATFLSVCLIFVYLTFYKMNFRMELNKLVFVLLIILNYGSFIIIVYSYLSHRFLSGITSRPYPLQSSAILALILIISYPVIFLLMEKSIKPLIASGVNNKMWRYLWMVPATFCLSYYYNLFSSGGIDEFSKQLNGVLFAIFYNVGSLFVTFLVSRLVKENNEALQIKADNYMLSLQSIQYSHLQNRMEETRREKHDLRQILTVIQSCLKDNNIQRLKDYMKQYSDSLSIDTAIAYSDDYALNALIVYYADMAHRNSIEFQATVNYPTTNSIADSDVIILFGNLLENALEACLRENNKNLYITLKVKTIHNSIVIALENSYTGTINKSGEQFTSSKGNRIGIGISSIQKIASKYNGNADFKYNHDSFRASVVLFI